MGVWDTMGEGISRAVNIWLQGREAQEKRRLSEEEKARLEKEWLFRKMQGEAGLDQAAWEREWAQKQAQETIAREGRMREEAMASQGREFAQEKTIAGMRLADGKEKEPVLYDKQGFNGEVALWLAMGNLGVKSDLELSQLLGGPQGQTLTEGLVNRLASVHGWRYPDRNLAADFWTFLKIRNPNLRSPSDTAAATAAQQQALVQQQAERERQQQERARLGAQPTAMPQLPRTLVQPQTPEALQQALVSGVDPRAVLGSPGLQATVQRAQAPQVAQRGLVAGGVPVPISAELPAALQSNAQSFTPDDLAKLQMYDEAPNTAKQMMKSIEPFRSLLLRRGR